jgi:hypothetical protein
MFFTKYINDKIHKELLLKGYSEYNIRFREDKEKTLRHYKENYPFVRTFKVATKVRDCPDYIIFYKEYKEKDSRL